MPERGVVDREGEALTDLPCATIANKHKLESWWCSGATSCFSHGEGARVCKWWLSQVSKKACKSLRVEE